VNLRARRRVRGERIALATTSGSADVRGEGLLIDTCVWLDLAKEPRQTPALGVIEELVRRRTLTLIVPRVLLDEFRRDRDRVAKESARSLASHFRVVKDAITRAGGDKRRLRGVLAHLDDVDHKIPLVGGAAEGVLDRIETLLAETPPMEPSDAAKLRASQRALEKKAPFHITRTRWAMRFSSRRNGKKNLGPWSDFE
jgi:PIN domain